jgi:hypothetical protein
MTLKERILLILEGKFDEALAKENFLGYTTADGQQVNIDNLQVGGKVTLMDNTPLPAGNLTLADGTQVTVGENGTISALVPPQPQIPQAPPAPGAVPVGMEAQDPGDEQTETKETHTEESFVTKETFAALEEKLKAQDEKILALETLISDKVSKSEQAITELAGAFEAAKVQPSAEPVGKKKPLVEVKDKTNQFIKDFAKLKN